MSVRVKRIGTPFALVVPPLLVALSIMLRVDAAVGTPIGARCMATLHPDTVPIQQQPVIVSYMVPDTVGLIVSVTAPVESGIQVDSVNTEGMTLGLTTTTAVEGSWPLTFVAEQDVTCSGNLNVRPAPARRR